MELTRNKKPMCDTPTEELSIFDYSTKMEDSPTGGKMKVTRFSDGSTTYHGGGPGGPISFDEYGRER